MPRSRGSLAILLVLPLVHSFIALVCTPLRVVSPAARMCAPMPPDDGEELIGGQYKELTRNEDAKIEELIVDADKTLIGGEYEELINGGEYESREQLFHAVRTRWNITSPYDGELLGTPVNWQFGRPVLRTAMRLRDAKRDGSPINGPTSGQMRRQRSDELKEQRSEVRKVLRSVGISAAQADRCFRDAPRLPKQPARLLCERLEVLQAALPQPAVKQAVIGAPSLLLHTTLHLSLPEKLSVLGSVTGLAAERVVLAAPTLLLLDSAELHARAENLQAALPELELRSCLQRMPRLLGLRADTLRASFDELSAILPDGVHVGTVVQRQPTLIATSRVKLLAKCELLRELCSEEEWKRLLESTSFARALTASVEVIERLRVAPKASGGGPRPVVKILLMAKADYAQHSET